MTPLTLLWIAMGGLGFACLAAVGVRSLAQFSPHELNEICKKRGSPERLGRILRWRDQVGLSLQSVRTLAAAVYVGAATLGVAVQWGGAPSPDRVAIVASALGGAVLLLAVGIWLPRAVADLWAEPFLYLTWPIWWGLSLLLFPLILAARLVNIALHRLAGRVADTPDEDSFEEDIRTIVTEGHREGLLEEEAREMIEGVIELGDADVSQIMTPRTDMVSLSSALSWPGMLDAVISAGHTRIPVYGRNRDDILGILYTKDLLPELAKPSDERVQPWTKLLREPLFVPETKPIDALLQELQHNRNHMAVVLDEYGGVSGLVTMEDVLEEIVGEIVDESDSALVEGIRELGPGVCESLGRVHVDELNERFGLHLPEDADYDTIGGFVFSEMGRIPVAGEQLTWENVRITVIEATRRRIERVRMEVLDAAARDATRDDG